MKKLFMHSHRLLQTLALASVFLLSGCEKTQDVEPTVSLGNDQKKAKTTETKIYYGDAVAIGDGTAWVWVEVMQGKPIAMGIEFTEGVLDGISEEEMYEFVLPLPGQAHSTGYKTVTIGWNPMGHEPTGVYTLPHFDFHFYMQTEGQIMQIAGGPDEGAWSLVGTVFPEYYTFGPEPMAVPHMGVHWSDVRSPEFSPAGFSRTFIYGSDDDRVTFLEPMITLEYLESLAAGDSETLPVPSLLSYVDPGYYPQSYTVTHTADGTYSIVLTDLMFRNRNR
jgi:hypothetical protein